MMGDIKKIFCKKIVFGIFLLTLGTTLMPSLTGLNLNYENTEAHENDPANLPTWVKGEKWIFNVSHFSIAYLYNFSLNAEINQLDFLVESITPDFYNVTVQGNLTSGELKLNFLGVDISGSLLNTSMKGYILFRKLDLGINKVVLRADGYLKGIIKHSVKFRVILEPQPEYKYINFPIYADKNWIIPTTRLNMLTNLKIGNLIDLTLPSENLPMDPYILPDNVNCVSKINVDNYEGYVLEGNIGLFEQLMYSPDIENLYMIKLQDFTIVDGWLNYSFYVDADAKFEVLKAKAKAEGSFQPGEPLNFTGSAYGGVLINDSYKEWRWDFGDGNVSFEQNPSHVYANPGNYTINLTVTDMLNNKAADTINVTISISSDEEPPLVTIIQPTSGFYIWNKKILPIPKSTAIIIGCIDIKVNATDAKSGINHVDFYINDDKKFTDNNPPYQWTWKWVPGEQVFGKRDVKIVAFDNAGNPASVEIVVWKFF